MRSLSFSSTFSICVAFFLSAYSSVVSVFLMKNVSAPTTRVQSKEAEAPMMVVICVTSISIPPYSVTTEPDSSSSLSRVI